MTQDSPDARPRLVAGAADLIGRRGLRASTVRELAKHSQTPEGSTYHYFPGGKPQLAEAAVRFTGAQVHQAVTGGLEDGPLPGLRVFIAAVRELITSTHFRGGCPVLAVAVEGSDGDEITPALRAAGEVFDLWNGMFVPTLTRDGVPDELAAQIGTLIVAALEGTVAMCRAKQDIKPFEDVATLLETIVRSALFDQMGRREAIETG